MKIFVIIILMLSLYAKAEVSLGINLSTNLTYGKTEKEVPQGEEYERVTTYALSMYPSAIIVPTGKFEIVPTLGFFVIREKTVEEDVDGEEREREDTRVGVGGGCGLFFRLIEGNVLRLSLGPDVFVWYGDENDTLDVSIGLPVNVDFLLNERWFLRLGSRLVAIRYIHEEQGRDEKTNSFTFFDIQSMLQARLGFYLTF
jgi:hypothetical protein